MKNTLLLSFIILMFSQCATHTGTISSNYTNKPVQYVDIAEGIATTSKVLCIGGLSKDALVLEAKKSLMKNRPLKNGEQYLNYTIDLKKTATSLMLDKN